MKQCLMLLTTVLLLASCSTDSQTDYVELDIPSDIQDPEIIKSLEKDAKQLNKVFNSMEDMSVAFFGVCDAMTNITEDMDKEEFILEYGKATKTFGWKMTKFMFNVSYLAMREEVEDKSLQEVIEKLTDKERQQYTKTIKHIKVKQDMLKIKADEFMVRLDSVGKEMERVTKLMESWKVDE